MFDLIETEIQARQVMKIFESFNVRNEIIVEIEVRQRRGDIGREGNTSYLVLP